MIRGNSINLREAINTYLLKLSYFSKISNYVAYLISFILVLEKINKNYLNEFCYKVNSRSIKEELFEELLISCIKIDYEEFVKIADSQKMI